jgi:hypothetical protein
VFLSVKSHSGGLSSDCGWVALLFNIKY